MKTIKITFFLLALAAFLSGCRTSVISYTDAPIAKRGEELKDWREIKVVHIDQLERSFEVIGECRGNEVLDDVIYLKKQAVRLNADAISIPEYRGDRIVSQAIKFN